MEKRAFNFTLLVVSFYPLYLIRSAKSVLQYLERLTYQNLKDLGDPDAMVEAVDDEIDRMKKSDNV